MSAFKRFIGGFATSLAEQNREDQKSRAAEEQEMRMAENRLKLERKYKERASIEERDGGVFEVVRDGEGNEIPSLSRKLNPTEAEEYRGRGLRAKSDAVDNKYNIDYGLRDKEEERARLGRAEKRAERGLGIQEAYARRSGGAGNEPTEIPEMINDAMYKTRDILETLYPLASKDENGVATTSPEAASKRMEIEQLLEEAIIAKGLKTSAEVQRELRMILQGSTGAAPSATSPKSLEGMGVLRSYQGN